MMRVLVATGDVLWTMWNAAYLEERARASQNHEMKRKGLVAASLRIVSTHSEHSRAPCTTENIFSFRIKIQVDSISQAVMNDTVFQYFMLGGASRSATHHMYLHGVVTVL